MEQLTSQHIEELYAYTDRVHFNYEDLKFEVVDHIATGVEEMMDNNPDMTFSRALYEYSGTLPHSFFGDIISEKSKALKKYWRKKLGLYLISYFTLPKIILTAIITLSLFMIYLQFGTLSLMILLITIIPAAIFISYRRNKKLLDYDKYLFIEQYRNVSAAIVGTFCYFNYWTVFDDLFTWAETDYRGGLFISFFIAFQMILYFAYIYVFPQFLKEDVETRYAHLEIKLA